MTGRSGRRVPRWAWTLFKVAVAAGVVALMFHKGLIRADALRRGAANWPLLLLALGAILAGIFLQGLRWGFLLRGQGIRMSAWDLFSLMMTGFFFNVVAPGSLGGDAVKAFLVARGQERKAEAATTVFLDRFLGLGTLLLVACVAIAVDFNRLWHAELPGLGMGGLPGGRVLALAVALLLACMIGFALVMTSGRVRRLGVLRRLSRFVPFRETVGKIYEAMHRYGRHRREVLCAVGVSIASQVPLFAVYYLYGVAVGADIELWHCALIVPPAMVIRVLPLAPGGAGQGLLAMGLLFPLVGIEEGGAIGALGDAVFVVAYLLGGIFFLFGRARYRQARAAAEAARPPG